MQVSTNEVPNPKESNLTRSSKPSSSPISLFISGREMKIRFCSGFTKPGFLLVHFEPPSIFSVRSRSLSDSTYGNLCNHKKRHGIGLTVQCAIANRRFSSRSVDSLKKERCRSSGRDKDKRRESQSLYSRPSLLEMNKEKAANRGDAPSPAMYGFNEEIDGKNIVVDEMMRFVRVLRQKLPIKDRLMKMKIVKNCFSSEEMIQIQVGLYLGRSF